MKRFVSILISALMILSLFAFPSAAADRSGAVFAVDELYRTASRLDSQPHTYEAWVKVEKGAPSSALGVLAGNYKNDSTQSYGFEVRENGNPFLWVSSNPGGVSKRIAFNKIDLRTGEWTHVAITHDTTTAYCYINGELKQTITDTLPVVDMTKTSVLGIGGDLRSGNGRWLKNTTLSSVALFSDMRTADEIKADMQKVDLSDSELLVSFDLSGSDLNRLKDLSANGNDLTYTGKMYEAPKVEEDTESGGLTFNTDPYKLEKVINVPIKTFEATIYFPKSFVSSERGGVIIGNYNSNVDCVNFEIYSDGSPRLYIHQSGTTYNFVFDQANVYTGEWVHLAIVRETSSKTSCYINGELVQSITKSAPDIVTPDVHVLGGDQRSGNEQYFKGRIKNVALYDDVRTAAEIKSDMTAAGKDGLICSYELDGLGTPAKLEDKSGNGYNANVKLSYFTEKAPLEDYAYSFAVLGDTQILAETYPAKFTALYDWVLGNVESKKIKFVLGLGDITNSSTNAEFDLAKKNIERMNGVVPYSLVRGNHDTENQMKKYFPVSAYKDKLGGYYGSDIFNSWQELVVGEIKYLIFTLDYGAKDAVLDWASEIIAARPEHNVIITTHAYLFRDGTTLDSGDVVPPSDKGSQYNNGDHMWDKLIKKHENIVLVLSGHDPCDYVVCAQDKGVNGNTVTQFLIDPQGVDKAQGGVGLVTMFYFSADGKTVQVETYSTDRKAFFLEENQFTVTLDLAGDKTETETTAEVNTEEVTEAPATEPEATVAPETTPVTEPATEKSGCGSSVSLAIVPMILLAIPMVFKKRKED